MSKWALRCRIGWHKWRTLLHDDKGMSELDGPERDGFGMLPRKVTLLKECRLCGAYEQYTFKTGDRVADRMRREARGILETPNGLLRKA